MEAYLIMQDCQSYIVMSDKESDVKRIDEHAFKVDSTLVGKAGTTPLRPAFYTFGPPHNNIRKVKYCYGPRERLLLEKDLIEKYTFDDLLPYVSEIPIIAIAPILRKLDIIEQNQYFQIKDDQTKYWCHYWNGRRFMTSVEEGMIATIDLTPVKESDIVDLPCTFGDLRTYPLFKQRLFDLAAQEFKEASPKFYSGNGLDVVYCYGPATAIIKCPQNLYDMYYFQVECLWDSFNTDGIESLDDLVDRYRDEIFNRILGGKPIPIIDRGFLE